LPKKHDRNLRIKTVELFDIRFGHKATAKKLALIFRAVREGCHCIESRDIGAYDTCMNSCKYFYANKKPESAIENYEYYDPDSPLILENLKNTDTVSQGVQKTFLKSGTACNQ
jgi:hypothetical protein